MSSDEVLESRPAESVFVSAQRHAGDVIAQKFTLLALISEGGQGTVWEALNIHSSGKHALKFLKPELAANESSRQRFLNEARAASRLTHPNIVQIQSFGIDGEIPFIVMELVEGSDLSHPKRKITHEEFLSVFKQIARALGYAHELGIIHRDLKPSNVLVSFADTGVNAKLTDFGIAKLYLETSGSATKTPSENPLGSPLYMSPEQCMGKPTDPRSDLYSFGCLMYEILEGQPPFVGKSVLETMGMHANVAPPPITKEIPMGMGAILTRLLAKSPGDRYTDAAELIAQLENVDPNCPESPRKGVSKKSIVLPLVLSALLAATCAVLYYMNGRPHTSSTITVESSKVKSDSLTNLRVSSETAIENSKAMVRGGGSSGISKAISYLENWISLARKRDAISADNGMIFQFLASLYSSTGHAEKGEKLLREAIAEHEKKTGKNNDNYIFRSCALAKYLSDHKQLEQSRKVLEDLLQVYRKDGSRITSTSYLHILQELLVTQSYDPNTRLYERELTRSLAEVTEALSKLTNSEDRWKVLTYRNQMLDVAVNYFAGEGEKEKSLKYLDQMIVNDRRALEYREIPGPHFIAPHLKRRAELLQDLKRHEEAQASLREAITLIEQDFSIHPYKAASQRSVKDILDSTLVSAKLELGLSFLLTGNREKASEQFLRAQQFFLAEHGRDLELSYIKSSCHIAETGFYGEADSLMAFLEKNMSILKNPELVSDQIYCTSIYCANWGKLKQAEDYFALSLRFISGPPFVSKRIIFLSAFSQALVGRKLPELAKRYLDEAKSLRATTDAVSPDAQTAIANAELMLKLRANSQSKVRVGKIKM